MNAFTAELLGTAILILMGNGTVANVLLEGDLLGHTTHGLQPLEPYLNELDAGKMTPEGDPEIVQDHGMSVLWNGCYLPGP